MKEAILMVVMFVLGVMLMDFVSDRRQPDVEESASLRTLTLQRKGVAMLEVPEKLSIAWLLAWDRRLERASQERLLEWKEVIADWTPITASLAGALLEARLEEMRAPSERRLHFTPEVIDVLAEAMLGDLSRLDDLQGLGADLLVEAIRSGDVERLGGLRMAGRQPVISYLDRERLWKAMFEKDREKTLILSGLGYESSRRETRRELVRYWASQDLEGAMAWVASLPSGRERTWLGQELLREAAKQDPLKTLEEIDRYTAIGHRPNPEATVIGIWGSEDPKAAAAWVETQGNPKDLVASLISQWKLQDLSRSRTLLETQPVEDQVQLLGVMKRFWTSDQGQEAMVFAESLDHPEVRAAARVAAAEKWASDAPETAWAMAQDAFVQEDGFISEKGASLMDALLDKAGIDFARASGAVQSLLAAGRVPKDFLYEAAQSDPAWVAELDNAYPDLIPNNIRSRFLETWLIHDPQEALLWTDRITDPERRELAHELVLRNSQDMDQSLLVDGFGQQFEEGSEGWLSLQHRLISTAAKQRNFESAMDHLRSLEGEHRARAAGAVFSSWVRHDPQAAYEAFESLALPESGQATLRERTFDAWPE